MSAPTSEALTQLLTRHAWYVDEQRRGWCLGCLDEARKELRRFADVGEFAAHLTGLIDSIFLVVPRSDIVGTEYGWRYLHNGQWRTIATEDRQLAIDNAAYQRESEGAEWPKPACAVARPVLPWSPIPLPEEAE